MSELPDAPCVRLAIVMERRSVDNPWTSEQWRPVEVREDLGESTEPRLLEESADLARWLHPGQVLTLRRDECEGYWQNLVSPGPRVFVLWRAEEDVAAPERITASYDEASAWMDADEPVESLPMPPALVPWVGDYLKAHFKPEPKKRIRPQSFKRPKDRAQS